MKKSSAFTLAETLVVIGLIGVVSALTLPNLSKSTNGMEVVAKVRKEHAVLSEAYARAKVKYGPLNTWFRNDTTTQARSTRAAKRMMEFMNVSSNCGTTANSSCVSSSNTKFISGSSTLDVHSKTDMYRFVTNDGTAFVFYCGPSSSCEVYFDIDGSKGFNTVGKDVFKLNLYSRGATVSSSGDSESGLVSSCKSGNALNCTSYILTTGNTKELYR